MLSLVRNLALGLPALIYTAALIGEDYLCFNTPIPLEESNFSCRLLVICVSCLLLTCHPERDAIRRLVGRHFLVITSLLSTIHFFLFMDWRLRRFSSDPEGLILSAILCCATVMALIGNKNHRWNRVLMECGLILAVLFSTEATLFNGKVSQFNLRGSVARSAIDLMGGLAIGCLQNIFKNEVAGTPSHTVLRDDSEEETELLQAPPRRNTTKTRISPVLLATVVQLLLAFALTMIETEPVLLMPSREMCLLAAQRVSVFFFVLNSSSIGSTDVFGSILPIVLYRSLSSILTGLPTTIGMITHSTTLLLSWPLLSHHSWSRKVIYVGVICLAVVQAIAKLQFESNNSQRDRAGPFSSSVHPIRQLMLSAANDFSRFETEQLMIQSLEEAVLDYQIRYQRLPPPGFDHWYDYARKCNTTVISQFDQINADLAPFWSIAPHEIRRRTYIAVQDRNSHISPLRIRNGTVYAPEMTLPTHYWLLEGLMHMMDDFVTFLPDMDIAINLDDEPRVLAVGKSASSRPTTTKGGPFSLDTSCWQDDFGFTDQRHECFKKTEREYRNTYDEITRDCSAEARQKKDELFVSNWQSSLDICKSPQLANTRGYFVSPSCFDTCNILLPIFSQSKPSTFNDILIPSPWDFKDKVGGDTEDEISWQDKFDRLHWRGTPSEGWAVAGSWHNMLRQSMVDLLGGAETHASPFTPDTALIYQGNSSVGYTPCEVDVLTLRSQLDPDVFFVEIQRGDDGEIEDELEHFRLQPSSAFKDHWHFRFLLDADGVAFSGRFIAFMLSHSLPFKFTSVFTEWWSERVFAHHHFVPVTLDSVYATWSYFTGFIHSDGTTFIGSHQEEAKQLAENGRTWAKQSLRKEDMKLYLWRLLLEYGRVIDDNRNSVGLHI